ncbi:MAG: glutamate synthase subunit beta [Clostridiales Family XIII bacterium]|jgi:glutamate synthase (NADPH/NADH) small chain|nr:glutamate synthase subunit beta [Clostridiales Family XIII bacterium]
MGKTTGFLEYERHDAAFLPVRERVNNWNEFIAPRPTSELTTQAARCMNCGVPFCHAAFVVEGRSIGCPLSNLIPEINDLVYRGDIEKAYSRLSKTHPFPEFTGRVCPALCESSCTLGEHEPAVTIKDIERYVIDEMMRRGKVVPHMPGVSTGKRIAVVGSGPSGLACADALNRLGDAVTVFERADRPGGLLMYGIPNMKLDKSLVLGRVGIMKDEGVRFELGAEVGTDYPVLSVMKNFDAIVLCCGATVERKLDVPGADLLGVMTALEFLTRSTANILDGEVIDGLPNIDGKRVAVVGGGDTGTDCVATSIRRGAASVNQLEIMPEPPGERSPGEPWPLWPKVKKTDYGQLEATELFGADPREYETTVKEIIGDGKKVTGVKTVRVEWRANEGAGGAMTPVELPGTERERPCDIVLTAMGFTGPERLLIDQLSLGTDARGCVAGRRSSSYRTNTPTVFAAGDMRSGPSLVVRAIDEGRRAARACHEYLARR